MDEATTTRDQAGRFVKGHRPLYRPTIEPGEEYIPHPTDPTRDSKGRLVAGPPQPATRKAMAAFRSFMLDATTPEQVGTVMSQLYDLCTNHDHDPDIRMRAIGMYLDRVCGKVQTEVAITSEKVTESVSFNLHKLSDGDLRQLEGLLSKTGPVTATSGPPGFFGADDKG